MRIVIPDINQDHSEHVVFRETNWDFYEAVLRLYDEDPTRMNFDKGTLEIMTLSIEHEAFGEMLGRMISDVAVEFGVRAACRGSTTLKLQAKERGLEADQCFWVANEAVVRGLKRLDLNVHPPPDLVVEVDVTHAVVDRESIYASLNVPEMWHFDVTTRLTAWELTGGVWNRIERSRSFPMIRVADLNPFLDRLPRDGDVPVLTDFRAWLRTLPR